MTITNKDDAIKIKKKFKVTFVDEIEAENLEDAYYQFRLYLSDLQHHDDITVFEFEEVA